MYACIYIYLHKNKIYVLHKKLYRKYIFLNNILDSNNLYIESFKESICFAREPRVWNSRWNKISVRLDKNSTAIPRNASARITHFYFVFRYFYNICSYVIRDRWERRGAWRGDAARAIGKSISIAVIRVFSNRLNTR